jgi:hypothetical protein
MLVDLSREEIESTLGRIEESFHMEGGNPEPECVTCVVKEKLRAALDQDTDLVQELVEALEDARTDFTDKRAERIDAALERFRSSLGVKS